MLTTTQTVNSLLQQTSSQTLQSDTLLTDGTSYYDPIAKQVYSLTQIPGLSEAHSFNEYTGAKQVGATKIMIMH